MKREEGRPISRREVLERCGLGLGTLALAELVGRSSPSLGAQETGPVNPLAAKKPHFPAKAKRVIQIFMNGGPSHVDTFDPKPALKKYEGQPLPKAVLGNTWVANPKAPAFPSPFKFQKHGQSGIEVSEIFPHLASSIDDVCVMRSLHTDAAEHTGASWMMFHGDARMMRPSLGSWITYGLGAENENLPAFVSMCPGRYPDGLGSQSWRSDFLPAAYQGTYINPLQNDVDRLVENIKNPYTPLEPQRRQLELFRRLGREHQARIGGDTQLESRIQSFELAYRMQMEAFDAFDISQEPKHVQDLYGDVSGDRSGSYPPGVQARQLLMARRLVERGVRYVLVWQSTWSCWDTHENNDAGQRQSAKACDQAIAGLLRDLKQRGMLEDTLVIWGGEFGRTPTVQKVKPESTAGRDHHMYGFTMCMAGGGVKGGMVYGATDEFGYRAVEKRMHVHDLHATILHQLGFEHEKLTYRHAGRDFRLTDVHGNVVREILL